MAGVLPAFWALQRRLYGVAGLCVLYAIGFNILIAPFSSWLQLTLYVAQVALIGSLANRLHGALLVRRGWQLTAEESTGFTDPKQAEEDT